MNQSDLRPGPLSEPDPAGGWELPKLRFAIGSTVWIFGLYVLSQLDSVEIGAFAAAVLILAIPMALSAVSLRALRRRYLLAHFHHASGPVYWMLSRNLTASVGWTLWALTATFLIALRFRGYTGAEWAVVGGLIPLFGIVFAGCLRLFNRELVPETAVTEALKYSRWLCPVVALGLHLAVVWSLAALPVDVDIADAIDAHLDAWTGSAAVREALYWAAYFNGLEDYALGRLAALEGPYASWAFMLSALGNLGVFYACCAAFSCFAMPRRAFEATALRPKTLADSVVAGAFAGILVAFIYFPAFAYLDAYASRSPRPSTIRQVVVDQTVMAVREVEQIDGCVYSPGTIESLDGLAADFRGRVAAADQSVTDAVNALFDRIENEGIEAYLKWYYSLTGEYGRIGSMLTGELEEFTAGKVRETLIQPSWRAGLETAVAGVDEVLGDARAEYDRAVEALLSANEAGCGQTFDPTEFRIVRMGTLADIAPLEAFSGDWAPVAGRAGVAGAAGMTAGVAAGSLSAVVVNKLAAKLIAKQIIKAAAKIPLKTGAKKVLTVVLGGAVAGSAVPVAGTAVGAVGGLVVGLTTGVVVDAALLKGDELLNREDLRKELVGLVAETRGELLATISKDGSAGAVAGPDERLPATR